LSPQWPRVSYRAGQGQALDHVSIKEIADKGELLGTYQGRGDANKALAKIAYAPEPQS
jgi:hypothetical protein